MATHGKLSTSFLWRSSYLPSPPPFTSGLSLVFSSCLFLSLPYLRHFPPTPVVANYTLVLHLPPLYSLLFLCRQVDWSLNVLKIHVWNPINCFPPILRRPCPSSPLFSTAVGRSKGVGAVCFLGQRQPAPYFAPKITQDLDSNLNSLRTSKPLHLPCESQPLSCNVCKGVEDVDLRQEELHPNLTATSQLWMGWGWEPMTRHPFLVQTPELITGVSADWFCEFVCAKCAFWNRNPC